ncbi:MAG: aspartate aminotransferase family protein [bacterium]|nr:aspartate aminotransferase family protein [bacterium]
MSVKLEKIIKDDKKYLFRNYGDRLPVCFTRGDGSYLYDQDNKEYIDFFSGIAVCNLGYNNKALSKALHKQVDSLLHSSNWYLNKEQIAAAEQINELSFPGKTLFCNSGAEANEGAIKLARKFGLSHSKNKYRIISFSNSFHGRTFASMTATAQKKIHSGFGPLPQGFIYLPFNDIKAFQKEIKKNKNIAAIMIELVQGEGGVNIADKKFIKEVFTVCQKNDIITIVDEVQTGIGRTGTIFAYQHYGVTPDIITMAKGLGGGIPIGAIHAKNFLAGVLTPGSHGTTFGGNHLACAAATAVLKEIKKSSLLKNVNTISEYIFERLEAIREKTGFITDIRGLGLQIGFELSKPGMDIVKTALAKKLVINCTAEKVIRIMPPLTIKLSTIKAGMDILEEILLDEEKKK